MKLKKLLSSFTFRYSLVYIALLSLSVTVVLIIVYAFVSYNFTNELWAEIDSEFNDMRVSYQRYGEPGVRKFLDDRAAQGKLSVYFYMVADAEGNKLLGNLFAWPQMRRFPGGWKSFNVNLLGDDPPTAPTSDTDTMAGDARPKVHRTHRPLLTDKIR